MAQAPLPVRETDRALAELTIPGLHAFSRTSRLAASLAQAEMRGRVLHRLQLSFSNTQGVLDALDRYDCILSGKWVLSLIDPLRLERFNHIDILAGNEDCSLLVHFLEAHENARLVHYFATVPDFTSGSHLCAMEFRCPYSTVRVIRSAESSPFHLVAHATATHLMNFVTSKYLLVAYPEMTFKRKGILVAERLPLSLSGTYTVERREGVTRGISCKVETGCGATMRWFDDEFCAVIGFLEGVQVDGNTLWRLGGIRCNTECSSNERRLVDTSNGV